MQELILAGPPVPADKFPGPVRFVMKRSSGPVDFWYVDTVLIEKSVDFPKDLWTTSLAGPCVLWMRKCKIEP